MLFRRLCILSFALVMTAPVLAAAPSQCSPYRTPITLDFKTLNPAPVYNNRLSVQGIRNLFREHTEAVVGPHARALGITYAETTYSAEGHSVAQEVRGGYCVYLTALNLNFGYKRMQVYVASEFAPGTCEYRAVLDHENQHVAIYTGALRQFAPRFRAEVEKILGVQQPVFTRSAQAGMDTALKAAENGMTALLSQFQMITDQGNAPLDSASNYQATAGLCANWDGTSAPPPQRR